MIMSSPAGHTSPQEDFELKPKPVYGISTGEEICAVLTSCMHHEQPMYVVLQTSSIFIFCGAEKYIWTLDQLPRSYGMSIEVVLPGS